MYETLRDEIAKKYGERVAVEYIDTDDACPDEVEEMVVRIQMEDKWLPVVAIGDDIVCEGVLKVPDVFKALKRHGVQ